MTSLPLPLTVVHAPGSLSKGQWQRLCSRAPGAHSHELRLRAHGAATPSGAQVEDALRRWAEQQTGGPHLWHAEIAGRALAQLPSGSPALHPGAVVLLTPSTGAAQAAPTRHTLMICADRGPDAGWLAPLHRGRHALGRSSGALRLADPDVGREHVVIDVGTARVSLRWKTGRGPRPAAWDAATELRLGSSTLQLVSGPAPAPSGAPWPFAAEPVRAEPPQGRHRTVLMMALLPMVVGIVLVIATGMWFFLLFSALSGAVALGTAYDARRRRRRFHRAVAEAGRRWARRVEQELPTPGRLIRLLREPQKDATAPLCAVTAAPEGSAAAAPVLRVGSGDVPPQLELPSGGELPEEPRTTAPAVVVLDAGKHTTISGPPRESRRLMRWLLVQLLLRPAGLRPPVLVVEPSPDLAPPPAADWPLLQQSTPTALRKRREQGAPLSGEHHGPCPTPVLLAPAGLDPRLRDCARAEGMHVLEASVESAGPHLEMQLEAEQVAFDGLSAETAEQHLRLGLSHCAPGHHDADLPQRCERALPDELMGGCAASELSTLIGRGAGADEQLDLVDDGPHILVAGTSGSGKSELLKSLLLGWAARYGPEEVSFMLFDFKGGSAFHRIADLEHSLGLVTDLSQAQAERTLEGIRSELVRREQLFLDAEAAEYEEYRRVRPEAPLPRLLVVFDEFRIFAHELPETMDELMRLATLGRSLGLHLVLATQRPQGVVTADIRANIGSILSLRLRSTEESRDLVGTEDAGHIPRNLPGRGILRRPGESPRAFQTVQLTPEGTPVEVVPEAFGQEPCAPEPASAASLVALLRRSAMSRNLGRPHTPILPPLPEELSDAEVRRLTGPGQQGSAVLGLVDDPSRQRRLPLMVDPARPTSLALLGEGESGGSAALLAVVRQLLASGVGAGLHLLDGDRSLEAFSDHPQVSSWIGEEHLPEAEHLLESLKEQLQLSRSAGRGPEDHHVVVVSGHSQWHAAAQSRGSGALEHTLGTLVSEGAAVGTSVLLSGGRELASGRLGARFARRVLLPFGVTEDTRHLWPRIRSIDALPGRGVLVSPEHPAPGLAVQLVCRSQQTPPAAPHRPESSGIRVRPLPEHLPESALPSPPRTLRGNAVVVGIRQFDHAPAVLELGRVSLITGLPGSGRSCCLELLRRQVPGAVLWNSLPATPSAVESAGLLLVDDAETLDDQEHRHIEHLVLQGVPVVAAARPSMTLFSLLPWAHHARSSPGNVVLSPTHRSQADPHAISIPVLRRPIAGRAVHLGPDGPQQVHWALPA